MLLNLVRFKAFQQAFWLKSFLAKELLVKRKLRLPEKKNRKDTV